MSQDNQLPQSSTSKPGLDEDLLDSLHTIPSPFDLALNGGGNRIYVSQHPAKPGGSSLLEPDAYRRLSTSTISSMGRSRGPSPLPHPTAVTEDRTWRTAFQAFWDRNKGFFLVSFSQLFGALMNVTTRLLELEGEGMHPFQILFARMSLTAIICCSWLWWKKEPDFPLGAKGIRLLLVVRGLTGFFGIYGMVYSLQYLPIADAVVITFLAPSVASYGCYLFLGEPFPRPAQYASLVSFLGVILIARPVSLFSSSADLPPSTPDHSSNTTSSTQLPHESSFPVPTSAQRLSAVAVAMLGVFGAAGAITSIRWIGTRAHPLLSVNYFAVWCTIVSTFSLCLARPLHLSSSLHFALPQGTRQWALLLFLGLCGFVMQYLLTTGLAAGGRGNGAKVTNMIYTNMLFALALDKVIFGQTPGWWSLGGSGLILGSALFVAMLKQQGAKVGEDDVEGGALGTEEERGRMLRENDEDADEEVQLREFPR